MYAIVHALRHQHRDLDASAGRRGCPCPGATVRRRAPRQGWPRLGRTMRLPGGRPRPRHGTAYDSRARSSVNALRSPAAIDVVEVSIPSVRRPAPTGSPAPRRPRATDPCSTHAKTRDGCGRGEHGAQVRADLEAEQRRAIDTGGIHHRADVVHLRLEGRRVPTIRADRTGRFRADRRRRPSRTTRAAGDRGRRARCATYARRWRRSPGRRPGRTARRRRPGTRGGRRRAS